MNKQELRGLPDSSRGFDVLTNRVPDARVAIIQDCPANVVIADYFDIIISDKIDSLAVCMPDIFVYKSAEIDKAGTVILPELMDQLPDTLLVVHKEAVKKSKGLKLRPKNYIVQASDEDCTGDLVIKIAKLIGAPDHSVWRVGSKELSCLDGTNISVEDFFFKKDKYGVPVNLKKKKRPLLMQGW